MQNPIPGDPASDRILTADFVKLFIGVHLTSNDASLYYLLPHYLELRGTSASVYGLAAGTAGLSTVVSLLLFGRHADRWTRKRTILGYMLAMLAGDVIAIFAIHSSIGWYFAARILQGVFQGLGLPLLYGWAVELCPPKHRYVALSWLGIAGLLSNTVGPFLSELLLQLSGNPADPDGFRGVFAMGLAFSLVAVAVLATVRDRGSRTRGGGGMREVLRSRDGMLILAMTLIFGGMYGSVMSFGKNYTIARGLTFVSLLMVMYTTGAIVSRVFIRQIAGRFDHLRLTSAGFAVAAVSFAALGFANGYAAFAVVGLIYGFSHGVAYPTLYVRFIDLAGPQQIGRSATIFQGAFSVGIGALPVLGGFIVSGLGFPAYFWLLALLCVGSLWLNRLTDPVIHPHDAGGRETG
jgi:MFS family permease